MIPRDWQRLLFNLLVGPPVAYLAGLVALCLMLAVPVWMRGGDAGLVTLVLFVGVPAIPLAYLFGLVPSLLVSIATSVLARFLGPAWLRIVSAGLVGALPYWLLATWMVGPQRQFDSAELNAMLTTAAPIGGAVGALVCAALTERFGSRRGMAERTA